MFKTKSILNELQSLISRYEFDKLASELKTDKNVRNFSSWEMLKVLIFAQLSKKASLRDIEISLRSKMNNWYHIGIKSISRNNLSNAMMKRSSDLFEKTFFIIYKEMIKSGFKKTDKRFTFTNKVIAIDSTTISLCLKVFDWAKFRKAKGGIKIHTMYDVKNQIPEFAVITEAARHDVVPAKAIKYQSESIYVLDRGYFCIKLFKNINENKAFFVTRTKVNTKYRVIRKMKTEDTSIKADLIIDFTDLKMRDYKERLRIVRYYDAIDDKNYEFITNNFDMDAKTIAELYKARWSVELFFKHMKQNLKIKTFIGTSENAVKIQIWTAMITLLLVEYIRFLSRTVFSSMEIIRLLGDNIFSGKSIAEILKAVKYRPLVTKRINYDLQLSLVW